MVIKLRLILIINLDMLYNTAVASFAQKAGIRDQHRNGEIRPGHWTGLKSSWNNLNKDLKYLN